MAKNDGLIIRGLDDGGAIISFSSTPPPPLRGTHRGLLQRQDHREMAKAGKRPSNEATQHDPDHRNPERPVSLVEKTTHYQILQDWMDKIEKRNPIFTLSCRRHARRLLGPDRPPEPETARPDRAAALIINMSFLHEIHRISIRSRVRLLLHDDRPDQPWRGTSPTTGRSGRRASTTTRPERHGPGTRPNVYGDGRICFGSTGANMDQSLSQRLQQTVNEFYVSDFNRDLAITAPTAGAAGTRGSG